MHATDADKMTPQERLEEIADILAEGFLRLRRRPPTRFTQFQQQGRRCGW